MPSCCLVAGCLNNTVSHPEKRFFNFPTIKYCQRREEWLKALHMTGVPRNRIRFLLICSDHFQTGEPVDSMEHPDYVPNLMLNPPTPAEYKVEIKEEPLRADEVTAEIPKRRNQIPVSSEPEKATPRRRRRPNPKFQPTEKAHEPKRKNHGPIIENFKIEIKEEPIHVAEVVTEKPKRRRRKKKTVTFADDTHPQGTSKTPSSLPVVGVEKSQSKKYRNKEIDEPLDLEQIHYHNELSSMGLEPVDLKKWKKRKVSLEYVRKYEPSTGETTDSASETEEMSYWYDRNILEKSVIELMQEHNYCEKLEVETACYRRKILALDHVDLESLSDDSSLDSLDLHYERHVPSEDPLNVPCDIIEPPNQSDSETQSGSDSDFLLYDYPEDFGEISTKIEIVPVEIKFEDS